ncbi:MAG: hypothetical protein K8H86_03585 [Ignavibacteriaceae bacterium]|nr:hypothetical protein [Ignavibacteriaceae bacterium]
MTIDSIDKWDDDSEIISTTQEVGLKLINKVIFTHIPNGPFNEKYYFFKRNDKSK